MPQYKKVGYDLDVVSKVQNGFNVIITVSNSGKNCDRTSRDMSVLRHTKHIKQTKQIKTAIENATCIVDAFFHNDNNCCVSNKVKRKRDPLIREGFVACNKIQHFERDMTWPARLCNLSVQRQLVTFLPAPPDVVQKSDETQVHRPASSCIQHIILHILLKVENVHKEAQT